MGVAPGGASFFLRVEPERSEGGGARRSATTKLL